MLNFDRCTVKHALQNSQNDCHHDSSRVQQIRFRPGHRPYPAGGAYSASPDPIAGLGALLLKGRERKESGRRGRGKVRREAMEEKWRGREESR